MLSGELKTGDSIESAWLATDDDEGGWQVGHWGVGSMEIVEVPGSGAMTPWIKVKKLDGKEFLLNCAQMAIIEKAKK